MNADVILRDPMLLRSLFDSLLLQLEIIQALAYRELRTRIRASQIGALGILIEPLLGVAAILIVRVLLRAEGGIWMNPVMQYGSGFVLYYLFVKVALRAINGMTRAKNLISIRRIEPIDVLIAESLVEVQIYSTCLVILVASVGVYEWKMVVPNPGESCSVFALVAITAFGVGLSALTIGHRLPALKIIVRFTASRILFWTSGLFFSVAKLPELVRPWMLWNPLLHGIELFRKSLEPTYPIPDISFLYLASWAAGSVTLGMLSYLNNKSHLSNYESTNP